MIFKITNRQEGNGIGSIIASIGIPLLIDALKGGSAIGRGGIRMGLINGGASPRMGMPMIPPPFIGCWETRGRGTKKTQGKGLLLGKKQPIQRNSIDRRYTVKFHKDISMSNFDLLDWCKYLKIPLEPHYMNGSHWVTTYVVDSVSNYFDSFGMPPFQEIVDHAKKKNLALLHQNQ